jgi:hypothetical protein
MNFKYLIDITLSRLFHETFQTHLTLDPEVEGDEIVFRFRGFRGDYTLTLLDTEGHHTILPDLLSLK